MPEREDPKPVGTREVLSREFIKLIETNPYNPPRWIENPGWIDPREKGQQGEQ